MTSAHTASDPVAVTGIAKRRPGTRRTKELATIICGLTITAVLCEGAIYTPAAALVCSVALIVIMIQWRSGFEHSEKLVTGSIGALTLWWLTAALTHRDGQFFPLGASLICFLAAYLAISRLDGDEREISACGLALIGSGTALIGLIALAFRIYPLAMYSDSTWRLNSTITYANAAGMLLAMVVLIAMSLDPPSWWSKFAVFVCLTGVIATQSRGAELAFGVGLLFVPIRRSRKLALPLVIGLLTGLTVVLLGRSDALHPLLLLPVAVGGGISALNGHQFGFGKKNLSTASKLGAAALAIAVAAVGLWFVVHPSLTRIQASDNGDRIAVWASAIDQWRSSPIVGVGSDHILRVHYLATDSKQAVFAHNEYLQVLADGGVIGATLLLISVFAVARSLGRKSLRGSCAIGALAIFATAAIFDFVWHLPALGLIGGWVAGLAKEERA